MREHPILFNGEMVRATMERRKTQTRRPMRPQPMVDDGCRLAPDMARSPFGQPGDTLWVRETWGVGTRPHPMHGWVDGIEYRADVFYLDEHDILGLNVVDPPDGDCMDHYREGWRPSIHMPRWASRTTLTVKRVWAERVQDITEADAAAEGVRPGDTTDGGSCIQLGFVDVWDRIYAARGLGWDANPWVWACEFEIDNAKEPDHG